MHMFLQTSCGAVVVGTLVCVRVHTEGATLQPSPASLPTHAGEHLYTASGQTMQSPGADPPPLAAPAPCPCAASAPGTQTCPCRASCGCGRAPAPARKEHVIMQSAHGWVGGVGGVLMKLVAAVQLRRRAQLALWAPRVSASHASRTRNPQNAEQGCANRHFNPVALSSAQPIPHPAPRPAAPSGRPARASAPRCASTCAPSAPWTAPWAGRRSGRPAGRPPRAA